MTMLFTSMIFPLVLIILSKLSFKFNKNKKKLYSFECGFNPFNNPQSPFSIMFFKILLIFLLFDMEIILVMPLSLSNFTNEIMIINFSLIMFIIIYGLIFEWMENSLEWLY